MNRFRWLYRVVAALALLVTSHASAQDVNILLKVDDIERRLATEPIEVMHRVGSRFQGDRTQRVALLFLTDSVNFPAKWATAVPGGETFNNVPRYELAVYEMQKLFLDEADYVVPPTVVRAFPLVWYRTLDRDARATFGEAENSVLVVLQYWLWNVDGRDVWDKKRVERGGEYARQIGNLNILTYLVRHNDANQGNFLISTDTARPRVFAVDNGLSFSSEASDRGYEWRRLRVKELPAAAVERLRAVTREQLDQQFGVLAEFEVRNAELVAVEPGENMDAGRGIRKTKERIQLGLTNRELDGVWSRLEDLLEKVDKGDIKVY